MLTRTSTSQVGLSRDRSISAVLSLDPIMVNAVAPWRELQYGFFEHTVQEFVKYSVSCVFEQSCHRIKNCVPNKKPCVVFYDICMCKAVVVSYFIMLK